jgi:hypothetical protein
MNRLRKAGLGIIADTVNRQGEVGPELRKELRYLVKPLLDGIQARPQGRTVGPGAAAGLLSLAFEHPVKMSQLPAESHGQGFKRARAAAPLDGMPLDFPHDSYRDMRTLRKLPLTPAKLTHTVTDSPSDRSPVPWIAFRHAFLRVPLPEPTLADHGADPHRTRTERKQTKAIRNN